MTESIATNKIWIALFSQSGSELEAVSSRLGKTPDRVFTNNKNYDLSSTPFPACVYMKSTDIFDRLRYMLIRPDHVIITLHGFLRILPPDICEMFEIYNGHPGDIITYPELRGKDPQQKALDLKHKTARAVIHRVTPTVDDGHIVATTPLIPISDTLQDVNVLINLLKADSVLAWEKLLKEKLS